MQCAPESREIWELSPLGVQRLTDNKKGKFQLTSWRTLGLSSLCLCSGQEIHYTPRTQHCSQENALPEELHGLILPCPWREHQGSLERNQCCGHALITLKNHLSRLRVLRNTCFLKQSLQNGWRCWIYLWLNVKLEKSKQEIRPPCLHLEPSGGVQMQSSHLWRAANHFSSKTCLHST